MADPGDGPHLDESVNSKSSIREVGGSPRVVAADMEAGDTVSVMSQVSIEPPAGPTQNAYDSRGGSSASSQRSLGDPPDKSGSIGSRVNRNEGYRKKRGTNTRASIHNIEMNAKGHVCMEGDIEYMSSSRNRKILQDKINRQTLEPLEENCDSDLESMDSHERTLVSSKPNSAARQGDSIGKDGQVDAACYAVDQAVESHLNPGVTANKESTVAVQGPLHNTGCNGTGIPVDNSHKRKTSTSTIPPSDEQSVAGHSINSKYVKIASQNIFAALASDKKTQYREQANKTFVRSSSSGSSKRKREQIWMTFMSKVASKYTAKQMVYIAALSVLAMTCVFSFINNIDDTNVVDMRSPTGGIMEDAHQIENGRVILMESPARETPHLRGSYETQIGTNEQQQIVESENPGIEGGATMQAISDPKPLEVVNTQDILSQLQYQKEPPSTPASTQPPPPADYEPSQQIKTLEDTIQDGQDMLAAISLQVEKGHRGGRFGQKPLPPYFAKHVEVPSVDQQQAVTQNEQGPPPPVEQQQIQEQFQIMDGQAFEAHLQSQAFNVDDRPIMNPEVVEMLLPAGVDANDQYSPAEVDQSQQVHPPPEELDQSQQLYPPPEVDQSQQQSIESSPEVIEADGAEFLPAPIVQGEAIEGADMSPEPASQQGELSPREEYLANAQDIAQQLMIAQMEHEQIMQQAAETEGQLAPTPQMEEQLPGVVDAVEPQITLDLDSNENTPRISGGGSPTDEVRAQRKKEREEQRKQKRQANLETNTNFDIGVPVIDAATFLSQMEKQEKNQGAISGTRAGLMEKEDMGPNDG